MQPIDALPPPASCAVRPLDPGAGDSRDAIDERNLRGAIDSLTLLGRMDVAERRPRWILRTASGRFAKVSESVYRLVERVQAGRSFDAIAREIATESGKPVEAARVRTSMHKVITEIHAVESRGRTASPFLLSIQLIPDSTVTLFGRSLSYLFRPAALAAALPLFALATFACWPPVTTRSLTAATVGGGYLVFLVAMLFHELGHGSAAVRFGVKPSAIGFTLYLTFPSFFCDVTSVWVLNRWQRLVVDLGGIYFQLLFFVATSFLYYLTHSQVLHMGSWMILLSVVVNLNPIFRFDGYWMLSDVLGVPNLADQRSRTLGGLLRRLWNKEGAGLPWSRWTAAAMAVYAVASLAFFVYFLSRFAPSAWATLAMAPSAIMSFAGSLAEKDLEKALHSLGDLARSGVLALVAVLLGRRFLRMLGRCLERLRRR